MLYVVCVAFSFLFAFLCCPLCRLISAATFLGTYPESLATVIVIAIARCLFAPHRQRCYGRIQIATLHIENLLFHVYHSAVSNPKANRT